MIFQQKLWKAGSAILWAIRPLIGYYLCTGLFMVAGRAIRHMQEQAEMFYGQSSNFYIFWGMVFFWWRMHRRCRKKGITLAEEITRIQLNAAMERLADTRHSIESIAQDCGFCSASHLGLRLKAITGRTPGHYRR